MGSNDGVEESQTSHEESGEDGGELSNDFELLINQVDLAKAELVLREVRIFTALNGFVNVHLSDD